MTEEKEDTTVNLEINITSPSSPFLPLQIYHLKKQINVPVTTKIEDTNPSMVGGGSGSGSGNNSNGIFGFFKSFFQGFSQNTLQTKKHNHQNKKHLDKLFFSGNSEQKRETDPPVTDLPVTDAPVTDAPVTEEPVTDVPVTDAPVTEEPVTEEPVTEEPVTEEPVTEEPVTDAPVTEEPVTDAPVTEEPVTDVPVTEEPEITKEIEITKITLIADKIDLRESLKGTKIYFLEKRKDLPSHYI